MGCEARAVGPTYSGQYDVCLYACIHDLFARTRNAGKYQCLLTRFCLFVWYRENEFLAEVGTVFVMFGRCINHVPPESSDTATLKGIFGSECAPPPQKNVREPSVHSSALWSLLYLLQGVSVCSHAFTCTCTLSLQDR